MHCFSTLVTLLAAGSYVAAHGYVSSLTSDGQTESGWLPYEDPYENPVPVRVVRKIPGNGPVMDITSTDIACNQGGNVGTTKTFDVNAGSDITFQWTDWPASHKGPVTTFMASCNGNCSSFTASNGKWFKIDQGGYANGQWAAEKLIANGNKWTSNIPAGLASGQYLVRYEIVALHQVGQPQYYPGCAQVNVKNGGADQPSSSDLTSFPGMYNGFKWPDIYTDNLNGFVVAGPNVVSFADSSSSDPSSSTPNPSSTPAASTPHPSSTPAASTPHSSNTPAASTPHSSNTPADSTPHPSSTPADSTPLPSNTPAASTPHSSNTPAASTPHPSSTPADSTPLPSSTPADSAPHPSSTPADSTSTPPCDDDNNTPKKRSFPARHLRRLSTNH